MSRTIYQKLDGWTCDLAGNVPMRFDYVPPVTLRSCSCGWKQVCHDALMHAVCPECGEPTTKETRE